MSNSTQYNGLISLQGFPFPLYVSPSVEIKARRLAARFEAAYHFFATLFKTAPQVSLVVLSIDDWESHAHAAFATPGMTHYTNGQVVTAGEACTFWQPWVDMVAEHRPDLLQSLRNVYRTTEEIDLTAHIETWIVHDLAHAFHLQASYYFPRVWLMEFFADLCLYTYIATNEPSHLPALYTLPNVVSQLPIELFGEQTLHDFDTKYTKMRLENYFWYHSLFFEWARQVYDYANVMGLQRLWQTFVVSTIETLPDDQLATLLHQVRPELAEMFLMWSGSSQ